MDEADGQDGWLTYSEAAERLRSTAEAVRRRARRYNWPRLRPNLPGEYARVRVPEMPASARVCPPAPDEHSTVPDGQVPGAPPGSAQGTDSARVAEMAIEALREQLVSERRRVDELLHQLADAPEKGPETDPLPTIAIQTLSQAVEMLREDVGHERDRADQAERRIDELLHDLADARTAAMITGCEAAALRAENALLKARPWWWRWFR